jgi:hypothetical protein
VSLVPVNFVPVRVCAIEVCPLGCNDRPVDRRIEADEGGFGAGFEVEVCRDDRPPSLNPVTRYRWTIAIVVTVVLALLGMGAGIWFFTKQGVDKGDKWASIFSFGLAGVLAITGALLYLIRKARGEAEQHSTRSMIFNVEAHRDAYTAKEQTFHQYGERDRGKSET